MVYSVTCYFRNFLLEINVLFERTVFKVPETYDHANTYSARE